MSQWNAFGKFPTLFNKQKMSIIHIVNTSGFFTRPKIIYHYIEFDAYFSWLGGILFFGYEKKNSWLLLDTARLCWMDFYDALRAPLTGFMRCEVTAVKLKVQCYGGSTRQKKNAHSALSIVPSAPHSSKRVRHLEVFFSQSLEKWALQIFFFFLFVCFCNQWQWSYIKHLPQYGG